MASLIAWLDASAEEQRRMREIIRLFSDRDSRDELGLGQIRDAISDRLFPGTSTLLTRARYLLFVPWCLQKAAQRPDPVREADRYERVLIGAIKDSSDTAGLLGMRAGATLRNLPSSVYWSMLRHYGILTDPDMSREDAVRLPQLAKAIDDLDGDSGDRLHVWSASMPAAPPGFPQQAEGGFSLTADEAQWLRDRLLDGAPGSLLSHLLVHAPMTGSGSPWHDESALTVRGPAQDLLENARAFSAVMHGAQLLYNLLIAEEYDAAGYDRLSDPVTDFRERLDAWADALPSQVDLAFWDLDALLRTVELQRGGPVHPSSRRFVVDWTRMLTAADPRLIADDEPIRRFLRQRERQHKGAQARIGNKARLANWGGASGSGAMVFRWPTVRGILTDIHEGLAH